MSKRDYKNSHGLTTAVRPVWRILLVLLLVFIWGHSCMPVRVSAAESGWVTELLKPLFELFVGEGNVTDHLVRKTAHVAEFAALGFVLLFNWRKGKRFSRTLSAGLLVALLDETIQMFSDRGDMILDVWFDFAGVLIGAVLAWLIFACKKRRAAL